MATVLAVVPAREHGQAFEELAREFPGHEILVVESTRDVAAAVGSQVPDLVLFPLTLPATEQKALTALLGQWDTGPGRGAVVSLTASTALGSAAADRRWFYWLRPAKKLRPKPTNGGPPAPTYAAPVRVLAACTLSFLRLVVSTVFVRASAFWVAVVRGLRVARIWGLQTARRGAPATLGVAAARSIARIGTSSVVLATASLGLPRAGALTAWRVFRSVALFGASWVARGAASLWAARARTLRLAAAGLFIAVALVLANGATRILSRTSRLWSSTANRRPPVHRSEGRVAEAAKRPSRGRLQVTSEPPNAAVLVDGQPSGFTPLLLDDLTPGQHIVTLEQAAGSVRHVIKVKANETTTLNAPIYSGWLALFAPFELQIWDGGRTLNLDERHRVLLSPGRHELQFANRALGYRGSQAVVVQPGEVTAVSLASPKTAVSVTASAPAEVWIDGIRVGQTPIVDQPVAIGTREFVLRNAAFGERRVTATVTTKPFHINIDFAKPDA